MSVLVYGTVPGFLCYSGIKIGGGWGKDNTISMVFRGISEKWAKSGDYLCTAGGLGANVVCQASVSSLSCDGAVANISQLFGVCGV